MRESLFTKSLFAAAAMASLSLLQGYGRAACAFSAVPRLGQEVIVPSDIHATAAEQAGGVQAERSHAPSIVGLWKTTFYYQGQVEDVAFETWGADGTEILNDYTNPIEGNVCLGVWAQTGPQTVKLKHPSWTFDGSGNLTGTAIIHETVTVDPDGETFSGPYSIDIYDTSGHLMFQYEGSVKGSRIRAE